MAKFARLDDAFSEVLTGSKPSIRAITAAKDKKRRQRKGKKKQKCKDVCHFLSFLVCQNFDFCTFPSENVLKRDGSGKKGLL